MTPSIIVYGPKSLVNWPKPALRKELKLSISIIHTHYFVMNTHLTRYTTLTYKYVYIRMIKPDLNKLEQHSRKKHIKIHKMIIEKCGFFHHI